MHVVFRVDASLTIGTGHVSRCLALAQSLGSDVNEVVFLMRDRSAMGTDLVSSRGYKVCLMANESMGKDSWFQDAKQTSQFLNRRECPWDIVVVDHYDLDARWERVVRKHTRVLVAIDDMFHRPHECDIVVNPSDTQKAKRKARPRGMAGIKYLSGGSYAFLDRRFSLERENLTRARIDRLHTLQIFFGGTDEANHTERFSRWVACYFPHLKIQIVISKWYPYLRSLKILRGQFNNAISLYQDVPMAPYMSRCEMALGSPGTTTWERACLGLAPAYVSVNPNQEKILQRLEDQGLCVYFGAAAGMVRGVFLKKFSAFLENKAGRKFMGRKGMALVDGQGAERVVNTIRSLL